MADENIKAAQALRKLGQRVQHGLTKLHPVTDRQMAKVREAVRQQWEQTHPGQEQSQSARTASATRQKTKRQQQSKSRSHDHGHSQ